MTPTEKQKCIAEQAVYGDLSMIYKQTKIFNKINNVSYDRIGVEFSEECTMNFTTDDMFPVLRPISDLTKSITHKGYNDDKPFVPSKILASMWFDGINSTPVTTDWIMNGKSTSRISGFTTQSYIFNKNKLRHQELDLLHLWHFDTRSLIEKGEAISTDTLTVNPYEV